MSLPTDPSTLARLLMSNREDGRDQAHDREDKLRQAQEFHDGALTEVRYGDLAEQGQKNSGTVVPLRVMALDRDHAEELIRRAYHACMCAIAEIDGVYVPNGMSNMGTIVEAGLASQHHLDGMFAAHRRRN